MSQPRQRCLGARSRCGRRACAGRAIMITGRPSDARRLDLGVGGAAARVLATRSRRSSRSFSRRSSASRSNGPRCCSRTRSCGRTRSRRVDEAGDVVVLGDAAKKCSSCRPRAQEHAARRLADGQGRGDGSRRTSASCRRPQASRRDGRARPARTPARAQADDGVGGDARRHRDGWRRSPPRSPARAGSRRGRRRRRSRRRASRWAAAWARRCGRRSDRVASKRGSPARSSASAEASVVPPRMRTRMRR